MELTLTIPPIESLARMCARQAGYPDLSTPGNLIRDEIFSASETVAGTVIPDHVLRIADDVHLEKGQIHCRNLVVESLNWSRLASKMEGDIRLFAFALTLGKGLDLLIAEQGKDRALTVFLLDACGSALAELFARNAQKQIDEWAAREGLSATRRFSPGYCDWEISRGQTSLFDFLDPRKAGISVAASGLMTPRKSVSAVILCAPTIPERAPCSRCAKDCNHRREPFKRKSKAKA